MDRDELLGAVIGGTFRVDSKLAEGGMGAVYLAEDTRLERRVALKVVRPELGATPEYAERFVREAKVLASITHPGLPTVFAFGNDHGRLYMALEYLEGRSLHELLRQKGILPPRRASGLGVQILDALEATHARSIIHRDMKPSNVMVIRRGGSDRVKILDFGVAKARRFEGKLLSDPNVILGTPEFLAPEQIKGDTYDHRCDLYAVGVILYQVLLGQPPFSSPVVMETLSMHVRQAPVPPRKIRPDLPPDLERVILRALEKDPDARYQDAKSFADELEAIVEALSSAIEPGSSEYPVRKS